MIQQNLFQTVSSPTPGRFEIYRTWQIWGSDLGEPHCFISILSNCNQISGLRIQFCNDIWTDGADISGPSHSISIVHNTYKSRGLHQAPVNGHETNPRLSRLRYIDGCVLVCCVGCLPQCAISLITPNSSEMIMPCHIAIFRHKFYLIIKPYTHLVHLVIELCINFVYSIKN